MSHSAAALHRTTRTRTHDRALSAAEQAMLAILAVVLIAIAATSGHSGLRSLPTTSVLIDDGDTVWSIAEAHPVKGLTTAQMADLILEVNGADSPHLADGQVLLVPTDAPVQALAMR